MNIIKMRRKDREVSDNDFITDIINRTDVCRLAFAVDNEPYIVTMNFGFVAEGKGSLYFHCAGQGRKLEMISKNNRVCFAMDTDHKLYGGEKGCDWGMNFSSVVGYGTVTIITDDEKKKEGLNAIMAHYGALGEIIYDTITLKRTTILRLEISEITGKKK